MSLYHFLPTEIIYDNIFPYIPCYGLSRSILRRQKKRLYLIKYIEDLLVIDDTYFIRKDILKNYDGTLDYYYEDELTYFYCNLRKKNDYIYIIN